MNILPLIDSRIDTGTATNQLLQWNNTTKRWETTTTLTGMTLAGATMSGTLDVGGQMVTNLTSLTSTTSAYLNIYADRTAAGNNFKLSTKNAAGSRVERLTITGGANIAIATFNDTNLTVDGIITGTGSGITGVPAASILSGTLTGMTLAGSPIVSGNFSWAGASTWDWSDADKSILIKDDTTDPFTIKAFAAGADNDYISISTVPGGESISLGNTITNPDIILLGSGAFTKAGSGLTTLGGNLLLPDTGQIGAGTDLDLIVLDGGTGVTVNGDFTVDGGLLYVDADDNEVTVAGTLLLENGEYISNSADGVIRIGSTGAGTAQTIDIDLDAPTAINITPSTSMRIYGSVVFSDDNLMYFGTSQDSFMRWRTGTGSNHFLQIRTSVGSSAGSGYITMSSANRAVGTTANTTLRIFSAAADDTKYIDAYHNQTSAVLASGAGGLVIPNNVRIGDTTAPTYELEVNGTAVILDNLAIGTATPSGGFSGAGDIYAKSGIKAMEGLYSEAVAYGAGLEVADNELDVVYTSPIPGTATLDVSEQELTQAGVNFTTEGVEVGNYLKVITATTADGSGEYIGATGEIIAMPTPTTLVLSFGAAGTHSLLDATAMAYVIYPEPLFFVGDHGDIHAHIGINPDASFKICAEDSNNDHAVHFVLAAGVNNNCGLAIEYDADVYGGTSAMCIGYDATAFAASDTLGTIQNIIVDNTGATAGDVHSIDVALSDPSNSDLEVEALVTHEGVDPIAQYLGEPATLAYGATYDTSATTYTNETADFNNNAVHTPIFTEDDDYVYIASTAKFDEINILLQTAGSHSIIPTFEFSLAGGTWTAFTPADDTIGFSQNGTIRFESDLLTNWGVRTVTEVTSGGLTGSTDYYWIRIKRTRKVLPTPPIEDTIQVTALGAKLGWDKAGRLAIKTYSQAVEPTVTDLPANKFCFWIDTGDSSLHLCYNQSGTVKTVAMT